MFVCICRAVTQSTVIAAVNSGATTPDAVESACGAGADCGTCRADIADILRVWARSCRAESQAA